MNRLTWIKALIVGFGFALTQTQSSSAGTSDYREVMVCSTWINPDLPLPKTGYSFKVLQMVNDGQLMDDALVVFMTMDMSKSSPSTNNDWFLATVVDATWPKFILKDTSSKPTIELNVDLSVAMNYNNASLSTYPTDLFPNHPKLSQHRMSCQKSFVD